MKKKKINNKERKQIKQKKTDGNSKSKTQQNRGVPPLCHTPAACDTPHAGGVWYRANASKVCCKLKQDRDENQQKFQL